MDELIKRLREVADEVDNDYDVDPYNAEQRCLAILQAADAMEELSAAVEGYESSTNMVFVEKDGETTIEFKPKWIPVKERLPDFEGCALCMRKAFVGDNLRYQDILYYDEDGFRMKFENTPIPAEAVTHWMPLPEPPTAEEGE